MQLVDTHAQRQQTHQHNMVAVRQANPNPFSHPSGYLSPAPGANGHRRRSRGNTDGVGGKDL
jgi:hypothetical protein